MSVLIAKFKISIISACGLPFGFFEYSFLNLFTSNMYVVVNVFKLLLTEFPFCFRNRESAI